MASLADGIKLLMDLKAYEIFVPFILVYSLVYAVLKTNALKFTKDVNDGLKSVIALAVALLVSSNQTARLIIINTAPHLTTFAIILFLLIFLLITVGVKQEDIVKYVVGPAPYPGKEVGNSPIIWSIIIVIGLVIIVSGLSQAFPDLNMPNLEEQARLENKTLLEKVNELSPGQRIIFFTSLPQVLGMIIILLFFGLAAMMIANEAGPKT